MDTRFDVVIAGGGLAGLTLGLQLRRALPDATVAIVERTRRPLPVACHKVGESHVELSTHYYCDVLGLADYLDATHLKKNGLRFLTGDTRGAVAARPEIGPAEFPIVPSYQVDRGRFENDLRAMAEDAGVTLVEGVSVSDIALADAPDAPHRVRLGDGSHLDGRWVVDATGRRRLLQKKLGLRRPSPNRSSAAWFRVARRIKLRELVPEGDRGWHGRDSSDTRWLSTVHLMGPGYWVWLIPLSSDHTSVGIVADAAHHPFGTFNKAPLARAWLEHHEPVLASFLEPLAFEDFRVMHDYSYLTARFASADRWACVGEAAVFVDPLYSLGNDFLSMANSYTTRLVADDLAGDGVDPRVVDELSAVFNVLSGDAARTLSGNGDVFPHADVFGAKLWWDFFHYWSSMCAHFFQRVYLLGAEDLARFRGRVEAFRALNRVAQKLCEAWAELKADRPPLDATRRGFVPLPMFPSVLADQHLALGTRLSPEEAYAKMGRDLETGRQLVAEIAVHALRDLGPEHAETLGRRTGLAEAGLPLDARGAVDGLPRRGRLAALPPVGRDLERALGRREGPVPLAALLDAALAAGAAPATVPEARP